MVHLPSSLEQVSAQSQCVESPFFRTRQLGRELGPRKTESSPSRALRLTPAAAGWMNDVQPKEQDATEFSWLERSRHVTFARSTSHVPPAMAARTLGARRQS